MSESRAVRRPSLALLALEAPRAAGELGLFAAARPLLARAPRGDGHPVLVLPGFGAADRSTGPLRGFLRSLGYHVHGWRLGRNLGPDARTIEGIGRRLEYVLTEHGRQPMSIVGWSLGGIYAREIARRAPEAVRQVITLGSPFRPIFDEESYPAAALRAVGRRAYRPDTHERLVVPTTAIFSRSDGIVPWRSARDDDGEQAESIEVIASHCGLAHHPAVLWAIADRLAQPAGEWKPFRPSGPWAAVYPVRRP